MPDSNMTRRDFLTSAFSTALAATLASSSIDTQKAEAAPVKKKPNLVVILFDDLGCKDLNCLGAKDLLTPNIDKLANEGTVLRNWYSTSPMCSPARASLLTGRSPIRCGVPDLSHPLPVREITLADILKKEGYATGITGKWHLGDAPDRVPNSRGFDYFYGFTAGCVDYYSHRYYWGEPHIVNYHDLWRNREEIFEDGEYLTERIGDEACQFIAHHRNDPFFLYVPFNAVHYPMHAPKKYVERFPHLDKERQMYAAMLSAADDAVGKIVNMLEKSGVRENTMIVLSGDNGATRERRAGLNQKVPTAGVNLPYRGFKFSDFDGGMHVPGLVNWPGKIPAGQVSDELVLITDVLPTFAKLIGAQIPTDRTIDGFDFWPVVTENAHSKHEYLCWADGPQLAVRYGKWKLVLNGVLHNGTQDGDRPLAGDDAVFLSDLSDNPGETVNRASQYPEVVDQLKTYVQNWRKSVEEM